MTTDKRTRPGNPISTYLRRNWFWLAANLAAALPLLVLLRDFAQGNLGVDPINTINNATGRAAIALLLLSLAATPLHTVFGFRRGLTVRKSLGLWAFVYASFHLLNFVGLDYGFDVQFLLQDALLNKPYIVAGLASLLILLPLAITSTRGWMRRLGRNWKRLHRLVYGAGVWRCCIFSGRQKPPSAGSRCSTGWRWRSCCLCASLRCASVWSPCASASPATLLSGRAGRRPNLHGRRPTAPTDAAASNQNA
jgi:DMSO/TMAO reductase YedYZ heme-binding membrane subunit